MRSENRRYPALSDQPGGFSRSQSEVARTLPIGKLYRENAFGTRAALLPEHAFPKPVPDCFSPKLPIGHREMGMQRVV